MQTEEYLLNRVDNQIEWYSNKSQQNQQWFKLLRLCEIILSVSIPFLAGVLSEGFGMHIILGAIGMAIAIIAGVLVIYKFQEKWVQYRYTAESLKREKYLFLTNTGDYCGENAFILFVKKVESIISDENTAWSKYVIADEPKLNS